MIQCSECEHFVASPGGQATFSCDPFRNIKEPECLAKWQLIKLDMLVRSYQVTVDAYRRLAPMQEKMFRHMEREIEEQEEADRWKHEHDEDDDTGEPRI